ncbi:hypothetical protein K227x_37900 [Rubripirellula lacrimiformis]|uniref:Uncharacterized protein n=1 Tax=Rubripirellula lacrimiformis TaxID=1930273 RepID=A0A517NE38_9BACT|nr:hypothetical protein K227x_37900 [Rubripirellula lacrimiformis]
MAEGYRHCVAVRTTSAKGNTDDQVSQKSRRNGSQFGSPKSRRDDSNLPVVLTTGTDRKTNNSLSPLARSPLKAAIGRGEKAAHSADTDGQGHRQRAVATAWLTRQLVPKGTPTIWFPQSPAGTAGNSVPQSPAGTTAKLPVVLTTGTNRKTNNSLSPLARSPLKAAIGRGGKAAHSADTDGQGHRQRAVATAWLKGQLVPKGTPTIWFPKIPAGTVGNSVPQSPAGTTGNSVPQSPAGTTAIQFPKVPQGRQQNCRWS